MKKWVRCTRGSTPCLKTEKLKYWKTEKLANPLETGVDPTHTHPFAHEHFYTQTLLHTDRNFYTQTLLHTDTLTQTPFATQKLRPTDPIYIYTETLLHTNPFTLKHFYTQKLLHTHRHTHTPFCTRTLLHTDPLTHRQKLLHTNPFTHRHFDTETLWHTEAATHGPNLHTDPLTHKRLHSYTHTLLHPTPVKSQFYLSFCASTFISCEKVAPERVAPGQVRHK